MLSSLFHPPAHTGRVSLGLLILRAIVGLSFIQYAFTKLGHPFSWGGAYGLPPIVQGYATFAELIGALTPLGALLIAIDMLGAVLVFVLPHGGGIWISPMPKLTMEKNIFYEAAAWTLILTGPGIYSVDAIVASNARDAALLPSRR